MIEDKVSDVWKSEDNDNDNLNKEKELEYLKLSAPTII
jgi:hypothetical protein